MNIKKIVAAAVMTAAVTFGAAAKNHPYGMDIAVGIVGVDFYKSGYEYISRNRVNSEIISNACVDLFPIKVNTYCCPWLDNHLGIYGSVGLLWCGIECGYKDKVNDIEYETTGVGYNFGLELMAGPAFGVDLGDSSVRFQIGAPLHFQFGLGSMVMDTANRRDTYTVDFSYTTFGLGLTPQFRFGANNKLCFVAGMDFVFDFLNSRKFEYNVSGIKQSVKFDQNPFHFGWRPYLGLGINFGS